MTKKMSRRGVLGALCGLPLVPFMDWRNHRKPECVDVLKEGSFRFSARSSSSFWAGDEVDLRNVVGRLFEYYFIPDSKLISCPGSQVCVPLANTVNRTQVLWTHQVWVTLLNKKPWHELNRDAMSLLHQVAKHNTSPVKATHCIHSRGMRVDLCPAETLYINNTTKPFLFIETDTKYGLHCFSNDCVGYVADTTPTPLPCS